MVLLSPEYVVSFSSEDAKFPAENLLQHTQFKKWKCKLPASNNEFVILKLKKSSKIQSLEIGNEGAAFIEVQVSRSGNIDDTNYQVLLPGSSFMTPMESRNGSQLNRIRIFTTDKFLKPVSEEKWDLVKIICSQPFNKEVSFGLSFVRIEGPAENSCSNSCSTIKTIGKFTIRNDIDTTPPKIGSYFAKLKNESVQENNQSDKIINESNKNLLMSEIPAKRMKPLFDNKVENCSNPESIDHTSERKTNRNNLQNETVNNNLKISQVCQSNFLPNRKVMCIENSLNKAKASASTAVSKTRKYTKSLPFNQLLSGVIFAISGYQNPSRGILRQKGLQMGAQYRPDLTDDCTHLICAVINTPKFLQAKGKNVTVVSKEWIETCYESRIRFPCKKFLLDPSSLLHDEEIIYSVDCRAGDTTKASFSKNKIYSISDDIDDTDDEIEKVLQDNNSDSDYVYDQETDVDDDNNKSTS